MLSIKEAATVAIVHVASSLISGTYIAHTPRVLLGPDKKATAAETAAY